MGSFKIVLVALLFAGVALSNSIINNGFRGFEVSSNENNHKYGILGGRNTSILRHPYQAAILANGQLYFTGVILSKYHVLTIAISPYLKDMWSVVVGESKVSENQTAIHEVSEISIHPNFTLGTEFNVGILKLKKPLKFSRKVRPISIASESAKNGSNAVVSGYGINRNESFHSDGQLRELNQTVLFRDFCKPYYIASTVSSTTFCAYTSESQRPTIYDFGAPLVQNRTLVGIFITDLVNPYFCTNSRKCPSLYTDVVAVKRWISEIIKEYDD